MLLSDYCEKLVNDYREQGCKDVKIKEATTCKVGRHSYSVLLFGESAVPMDTEVSEDMSMIPDDYRTMVPGVQITVSYIKPKCRKESRDYKQLRIVQQQQQEAV